MRRFGAATVAAFLTSGCGGGMAGSHHAGPGTMANGHAGSARTRAADLQASLNYLLGERVLLAARATQAALAGRQAPFTGAAATLDANSVDISKAIGSVYGAGAEQAFLPL